MNLYEPRHRSTRSHTSVMTASGRYLDLLEPTSGDIDLIDVEKGLERARFSRQTSRPISVADHLLRCARIGLAFDEPLDVVLALLFHDAAEYVFGDVPGPLKPFLRVLTPDGYAPFHDLEHQLLKVIINVFIPREELASRVVARCIEDGGPVKRIDHQALLAEALLWMPGAEDWADRQSVDPRVWPAMIDSDRASSWGLIVGSIADDLGMPWLKAKPGAGEADETIMRWLRLGLLGDNRVTC